MDLNKVEGLMNAVILEIREIEYLLKDKPRLLKLFQEIVLNNDVELAQYCFTSYSESEEETVETEETEEWIPTSESEDEEEFNYHNV
jgi:hypothetical protein|tara:strand:- start:1118 stop:1378 length:261 start_codon:yes stop_codon:yes gene_type:complete